MKKYSLNFDVPGEIGEKTVLDYSFAPPKVISLHFVIKGWLGDDLVESFPNVFLVSEKLKNNLLESNLSGFEINFCEIEIDEQTYIFQPNLILPNLFWLKINGSSENDDFLISSDFCLTVSENALNLLKKFNLSHAEITALA
jgi:hypothetical protein